MAESRNHSGLRRSAITRWVAITLITLTLVGFRSDGLAMSSTQSASKAYAYDLVGWHLANVHSKWTHWLRRVVPRFMVTDSERLRRVAVYFELGDGIRQLTSQLMSASSRGDSIAVVRELEDQIRQLRSSRASIRNDVEEAIESEISTVVRDQGLGLVGRLVFPPVDVRLEEPPMVLVTSPRDRIHRLDDVLLESGMTIEEREEVEERVVEEQDISPLVLEIGGVATYPASVHNGVNLRNTLRLAAHEWVHHYLFLKPLGRNPYSSSELMVLNETVASIAGDEIGDLAYSTMQFRMPAKPESADEIAREFHVADLTEHTELDFGSLMRETRVTVDRLLAGGEVEQAEAYMEDQRKLLTESGHPIRKLNQAYFAFYGTYAHGPASVDPIGPQIWRLRELSADVGEFLTLAGAITSNDELMELLRQLETSDGPT